MQEKEESKISRREFIAYGASAAIAAHGLGLDNEEPEQIPEIDRKQNLVIIHLDGGNDGWNTFVPYTDETYLRARPNLALKTRFKDYWPINEYYGFHCALYQLYEAFQIDNGHVFRNVICQDRPTRSHHRAKSQWQSQIFDKYERQPLISKSTSSVKRIVLTGFDTHENQMSLHHEALVPLNETIKELRHAMYEDTLVIIYSELGRSLQENENLGTDHATTSLCIALGNSVDRGITEDPIDLSELDKSISKWLAKPKRDKSKIRVTLCE